MLLCFVEAGWCLCAGLAAQAADARELKIRDSEEKAKEARERRELVREIR